MRRGVERPVPALPPVPDVAAAGPQVPSQGAVVRAAEGFSKEIFGNALLLRGDDAFVSVQE